MSRLDRTSIAWVYKHIFNYQFTGIYPRRLENTVPTPRKLKATVHDRYESQLQPIGSYSEMFLFDHRADPGMNLREHATGTGHHGP